MQELRRLRKERGLTQAKLAVLADLDPSTLSEIETGARHPTTRTLEKLAGALNVEVVDLFPKALAAPSREPSLLNGLEEQRRARLEEWLAQQGHPSEEDFLSEAEDLRDESDVERAIQDLHAKRDTLLEALRTSEARKALFPVPPGLSREETRNWLLKPPGRWELKNEIRHEYLVRELALVSYSRQLFAEGRASDYLVYGPPGEHDHARHQRLLEARRLLRESYGKAKAA